MFRSYFDDLWRQQFLDQFEPDGSGYVYRKWQKGPPINVRAEEYEMFVEEFDRRQRYSRWGLIGGLLALTAVYVLWSVDAARELPDWVMYVAIGAVAIISIQYSRAAFTMPARVLENRLPSGAALTRAEIKKRMIQKTSYKQILVFAVTGIAAALGLGQRNGGFSGWGRLWLALAALFVVGFGFQAYRKWRFDRDSDR